MSRTTMMALFGIALIACGPAFSQQPDEQQQLQELQQKLQEDQQRQQLQQPQQQKPARQSPRQAKYSGGNVGPKYQLALPTGLFEWMKGQLKVDKNQGQPIEQMAREYDEKLLQIHQEFTDRCLELLTPEQRAKFEKFLRYQNWRRDPPKGVEMIKRNPWMFRILGRMFQFSDQQKEQIEVILKQYRVNLKALGEDEESKRQYSEATFNQIMTLLTPEQQQKVMDYQKQHQQEGK